MSEDNFQDLIRRIRTGDHQAAAELLRQYEPEIRRAVRIRMTDAKLRRVIDSVDVCQSVLANFFVRAHAGQFDLGDPKQLLRLLVTMARNKILDHARRQQADRRDVKRQQAGDSLLQGVAGGGETPSQIVAGQELMEVVRRRLSDEGRYLAEQRAMGREWNELADELGKQPDALRKQLTRELDRVMGDLGLDSGLVE